MAIHIFESPLPNVDLPEVPLSEYVLGHGPEMVDSAAMINGDTGEVYTFGQLSDAIASLAGGLQAEGFGPGSTIAVMAPNSPEFAIIFHAAGLAGGTVTTINPSYVPDEIRFQLNDANATMLFTMPGSVAAGTEAIEGSPATEVVVIGESNGDQRTMASLMGGPISQVEIDFPTVELKLAA